MIESEDTAQNPIDFSKVQYAMVKLDEPAKNWLESESKKILESKKFKKFYCDHLTLAYGEDELKDFDVSLLGKKAILTSYGIVYDDKCAALLVDNESVEEARCHNEFPHVTIATDGKTEPVYSNEIARRYADGDESVNVFSLGVDLTGTISLRMKDGSVKSVV